MSEILGVLFAVFIGTLLVPKFANYQKTSNDNSMAAVTAQQQKQFNAAVSAYTLQYSATIQGIATSTTPAVITVPMLQAGGVALLPNSFSATNPYGQTWQAEVLQPTAGNLQVLSLSTGGTTLSDEQASKIATIVGASGGLIPQNDSGTFPGGAANAYGSMGGWTIPTTNFTGVTGGHPASLMTFNNGQLVNNYLYRNAVPGQPQLNTMNTPLVMASVQTTGGACTTNGAIAQDGTGATITCISNVWTMMGDSGKCVPTSADLNTIEAGARCYNGAGNPNSPAGGDWFFLEVYRHYNTANDFAVQRVMGMTGASAGKVWHRNQQSGSANVGWSAWQQREDGQVSIWDQPAEGGVVTLTSNDGVSMHLESLTGGYFRLINSPWNTELMRVDQSGNMTLNQSTATNVGYINTGWAVETWGCSANGSRAKAAYDVIDGWAWNGKPLHCEAGVWSSNVTAGNITTNYLYNNGNSNVNDMYIRASGKWASQLGSSFPIKVYQCPVNYTTGSGNWATWGCIGQVSTTSTCSNYAYPSGFSTFGCTALN